MQLTELFLLQVRKTCVVERSSARSAICVDGRWRTRRRDLRESNTIAGEVLLHNCGILTCARAVVGYLIALQTYVGDWGEELLEGRVDVADFFD